MQSNQSQGPQRLHELFFKVKIIKLFSTFEPDIHGDSDAGDFMLLEDAQTNQVGLDHGLDHGH